MFNHSFIALALASLSIVSNAAAIPMDADHATLGAIPNAVLHKEVAVIQGGDSDKDVAAVLAATAADSCPADALCNNTSATHAVAGVPTAGDWLAAQGDSDSLQSFIILWVIVGGLIFFGVRKSESTK
jgi:hypothetical protein